MNIGARTGCWAGGWKNPYITDGLIAMWDGEWNVGGGIHDSNSGIWKDIVGSNDLTLFGSNYFSSIGFVSGNGNYARNVSAIFDTVGSVEVSAKANTSANQCRVMFVHLKDVFSNWNGFVGRNNYEYIQTEDLSLESSNKLAIKTSTTLMSRQFTATALYSNGKTSDMYYNGQSAILQRSENYYRLRDVGVTVGIFESAGSSMSFNGLIYCIRVYDRPLTDFEISLNHIIDNARFNKDTDN